MGGSLWTRYPRQPAASCTAPASTHCAMGRLPSWAAGNAVKNKLGRLVGYVLSNRMSKTVVVSVPWIYKHPKYIREVPRRTKYFAHDEHELCQIGDMVRLAPSRRLSNRKYHVVDEIIVREDGSEP